MNEQTRKQFEAKMDQAKKMLADTQERRKEYAETVGARWGDELGNLIQCLATNGGVYLKVLTILTRTRALPQEVIESLAGEFGGLQRLLYEASMAAYFKGDPQREVMTKAVEVMFERMMDNETSLASYMVDLQNELSKLIGKEQ